MVSLGYRDYIVIISDSSIIVRYNLFRVHSIRLFKYQFVDLVKSLINTIPDNGEEWTGDPDQSGEFYLYISGDRIEYALNDRRYIIQSGNNDLTSVKSSLHNFLIKSLKS